MSSIKSKNFKFIHLSDLHIGSNFSKSQDMKVTRHSINKMKEIQKIVGSELANLDRIIISGDISDSGDTESLLLARQWIRNSLEIGNGAQISIGLPDHLYSILRIIPGNHDAYNYKKVKKEFQLLYQKSLENYNNVFVEDQVNPEDERYDWIEKNGRGVFIYYIDTSYLGDTDSKNEQAEIKLLARPAKGKFSIKKSEKLLETFDKGMRGYLHNIEDGSLIEKHSFRAALKIIVMHHYLFEPIGYRIEPLLEFSDKETVFANIAMADFDILLCGHKHISDIRDDNYIRHFNRRAKTRYLINYFRRLIGTYSLPMQYRDSDGKKIDRFKSFVLSLLFRKQIEPNIANDKLDSDLEYLNKFSTMLLQGIDDPEKFEHHIKKFVLNNLEENIDEKELVALAKTVRIDLSAEQKNELVKICYKLKKIVSSLSERHFLQIMAGSATKDRQAKSNSFNLYEVEPVIDGYKFHSCKFNWSDEKKSFIRGSIISHEFSDKNRPLH